ncbi:MAG: pyridoxamine 5'-phosphate oxidase family protein [Veillonellales bacterium]
MSQDMRRKDRKLNESAAKEILKTGTYGVLSLNSESGYAYGVPLSYVYSENRVYFHWALEGQKLNHVRHDNKVSFCVVEEARPLPEKFSMGYRSVIALGKMSEAVGEEKMNALLLFVQKYSPDYQEQGKLYAAHAGDKTVVFRINIEHLSGKANQAQTDV